MMSITEALLAALLCFAFVFGVLACLYVLIRLFSFSIGAFNKQNSVQENQ